MKMLVNLLTLLFLITVGSCQECKSCKEAIGEVFEMAKSVMAGLDPLSLEDVEVCKVATAAGIKTIKTTGRPCIRDMGNGNFEQEIEIGFDELHMNCTLKSINAMAKAVGVPLPPIPNIKMPSFGGGSKVEKSDAILVDWVPISLNLKMRLNFDKDEYEVLSSEIKNVQMGTLNIHCEGQGLIMKSCELLTKPKVARDLLGLVAQFSIKTVMNTMFKIPQLKELITMLNCGEPDPPEE